MIKHQSLSVSEFHRLLLSLDPQASLADCHRRWGISPRPEVHIYIKFQNIHLEQSFGLLRLLFIKMSTSKNSSSFPRWKGGAYAETSRFMPGSSCASIFFLAFIYGLSFSLLYCIFVFVSPPETYVLPHSGHMAV